MLISPPSCICNTTSESWICWGQALGCSVIPVFEYAFTNFLQSRLCSWLFPEESASLKASHETLLGVQDRELLQEKVPVGYVRISPSLPCHNKFPSIMFTVCPLENTWMWGTNAIVFPRPWSMGSVDQADQAVILSLQLTCCCWTDSFIVRCFGAFWPQFESLSVIYVKGWKGGNEYLRDSTFWTLYSYEISSSVQLLSSCEEGGQRWLTDGEIKSRS